MERHKSYFVVSLDFELFWGMFDKVTLAEYGERILGEQTAIPRILEIFERYGIHATWATVGMLMARDREELLSLLPPKELRPTYEDMNVSSYQYIETSSIGTDESADKYHFGESLVKKILSTPHQEIGNHTFSHYYCIDGHKNSGEIFEADIDAFNRIAQTYDIHATSIVFPRNQTDKEALRVCSEKGLKTYRGNENHFLYKPRKDSSQSLFIRALRLLDHYVNISGYHTYSLPERVKNFPVNIPSSRFFRPWNSTLRLFEPLRMRRIKNAMSHAAKNDQVFHLWWHPHNFGIDQEENFKNLEDILTHFKMLQTKYKMQSTSISDLTPK
ncbi:MAG: polysaccharide deacetylase family protein [Candidatus Pacebacteria bacterium]|nr:polysaccharide deacetylase family protein [Candidatus Paceibacterota bacterium]MCF7856932.1 polysaccharide deacetylase family protein [Candidatus Paceibacterota bacterium]